MEPLENSLSTLRRTHFALFIAAGAVLILVAPSGPDYESASEELRVLREAVGLGGYKGRCASWARERYEHQWRQVARQIDRWGASQLRYADSMDVSGTVQCPIPEDNETLEAYTSFFHEMQQIEILSVDTLELAEALRAHRPTDPKYDWELTELRLLAIALDSIPLTTVTQGQDTFPVQFIHSSTLSYPESVLVSALYGGRLPETGEHLANIGRTFPVSLESLSVAPARPLDWLSETPWGQELLFTNSNGESVMFPRLRPFWEQIGTLWLEDAARYLQARAEQQQSNVEVLGMELRTDLVAWAGPFVVLILLVYLFAQLQHLRRIAHSDPDAIRMYPWIALFEGRLNAALVFLSVVLLPVFAAGAVSATMARSSPGPSLWAAGVAVACLVVGYRAFVELGHLRAEASGAASGTR